MLRDFRKRRKKLSKEEWFVLLGSMVTVAAFYFIFESEFNWPSDNSSPLPAEIAASLPVPNSLYDLRRVVSGKIPVLRLK